MQATKVLIAEDDIDDFEMLQFAMEELPLPVTIERVETGDLLIRALNEKVPDLLFIDIVMPGKDGKECLKAIRSNKKFEQMPIIIYSSLHQGNEVELCFREGANFYIIKPFSYGELKPALEKVFAVEWKKSLYYPPMTQFVVNHYVGK